MLAISNNISLEGSITERAMGTSSICAVDVEQSNTVPFIVHSLMCYRQNGESEEFARRAIESLIKKLKEKRCDLDALVTAITTNGTHPSNCVTIQRTLDGRMQIAGRKCLPHVIYARIWRWPDLHRNELKHCGFCSHGYELKQDSVCINPYHYERIVSPVDITGLSLSPSVDNDPTDCGDASDLSDSETSKKQFATHTASMEFKLKTMSSNATNDPAHCSMDRVNPAPQPARGQNTMAWSGVAVPNTLHNSCRQSPRTETTRLVSPLSCSTSSPSPIAVPSPSGYRHSLSRVNSSPSPQCHSELGSERGAAGLPERQPSHQPGTTGCGGSALGLGGFASGGAGAGTQSGGGGGGTGGASGGANANDTGLTGSAGGGTGGWSSGGGGAGGGRGLPPLHQPTPFTPSGSLLQPVPVLTTQRPPEFWCNIAYFELDQQVGELFKVPSHYSRVTVDGYTDPSSPNRFCLGQLSNVHRSEQSEKSRLYIGKGVELDNVGEGDVWIRCLSEFSVFVQSYYLDREAGRRPGDAVHKIYPGAYIKVFDIRQCHEQMKLLAHSAQLAAEHQAAVVVGGPTAAAAVAGGAAGAASPPLLGTHPQILMPPSASVSHHLGAADVGVDDLRRLCMLRLSFVKGWGPDYPRRNIKETPCWIEIQLHRPLQLLDEVLQGMPLNDRKPTRHFFNYLGQATSAPTGCQMAAAASSGPPPVPQPTHTGGAVPGSAVGLPLGAGVSSCAGHVPPPSQPPLPHYSHLQQHHHHQPSRSHPQQQQ